MTRVAGMQRAGGSHAKPEHPALSAEQTHALMLDVAGGIAAATLMLVITCWALSLGGAFQPGHVQGHDHAARAQH